jgi:NCS1 family nucleobase:cation symporter-1
VNPKRISFRKGGIITSCLALVSMPWNLYGSPETITYFLGGLGALLGPFFGIMAVDYFLFRKGRFSLPDLYDPTPRSAYYYRNGINPQAIVAFVPAAVVALTLALVPVAWPEVVFAEVAPFGWFIGAALGAVAYAMVTRGKAPTTPSALAEA